VSVNSDHGAFLNELSTNGNQTQSQVRIRTESLKGLLSTGKCMARELERLGVRPDLVSTWMHCLRGVAPAVEGGDEG
jgi:hypothetical protein